MTGNTHGAAGIAAAFLVISYTKPSAEQAALGILVSLVAAMFPDSWSFHLPWIKLPTLESHRGVSHFLITHLLIYAILPASIQWYALAGLTSHALLDMPTGPGVVWLWPLPWRFQLPRRIRARNGGALEKVVVTLLWLVPIVTLLFAS